MKKQLLLQIILSVIISSNCSTSFAGDSRDMIREKIEKANYCQTTEDCMVASFGCPFGCGVYINKKEEDALKQAVQGYNGSEKGCMYDCVRPPDPQCTAGQCVTAVCETGKVYQPFQCECPAAAFAWGYMSTPFECVNKADVFIKMAEIDGGHTPEEMQAVSESVAVLYDHQAETTGLSVSLAWQNLGSKGLTLYDFMTGFRDYSASVPERRIFNRTINAFVNGLKGQN